MKINNLNYTVAQAYKLENTRKNDIIRFRRRHVQTVNILKSHTGRSAQEAKFRLLPTILFSNSFKPKEIYFTCGFLLVRNMISLLGART